MSSQCVQQSLSESVRINYPHMVLIELQGEMNKKMAVSGGIRFQCLKSRIRNSRDEKKSFYFMVRNHNGAVKVVSMVKTIKEIHQNYSDSDGYLRVYIQEEAAF